MVPWYYQKGFVVLALLFVFPVGLVLLWRSPVTQLHGRIAWTLLAVLGFWIYVGMATSATMLESPEPYALPAPSIIPSPSVSTTPAYRPAPAWVPPSAQYSMSQYNSISDGMSYAQVQSILGSPGQEQGSNTVGGFKTIMYMWQNSDGSGLNAMFQNDKMMMKAQFGLK